MAQQGGPSGPTGPPNALPRYITFDTSSFPTKALLNMIGEQIGSKPRLEYRLHTGDILPQPPTSSNRTAQGNMWIAPPISQEFFRLVKMLLSKFRSIKGRPPIQIRPVRRNFLEPMRPMMALHRNRGWLSNIHDTMSPMRLPYRSNRKLPPEPKNEKSNGKASKKKKKKKNSASSPSTCAKSAGKTPSTSSSSSSTLRQRQPLAGPSNSSTPRASTSTAMSTEPTAGSSSATGSTGQTPTSLASREFSELSGSSWPRQASSTGSKAKRPVTSKRKSSKKSTASEVSQKRQRSQSPAPSNPLTYMAEDSDAPTSKDSSKSDDMMMSENADTSSDQSSTNDNFIQKYKRWQENAAMQHALQLANEEPTPGGSNQEVGNLPTQQIIGAVMKKPLEEQPLTEQPMNEAMEIRASGVPDRSANEKQMGNSPDQENLTSGAIGGEETPIRSLKQQVNEALCNQPMNQEGSGLPNLMAKTNMGEVLPGQSLNKEPPKANQNEPQPYKPMVEENLHKRVLTRRQEVEENTNQMIFDDDEDEYGWNRCKLPMPMLKEPSPNLDQNALMDGVNEIEALRDLPKNEQKSKQSLGKEELTVQLMIDEESQDGLDFQDRASKANRNKVLTDQPKNEKFSQKNLKVKAMAKGNPNNADDVSTLGEKPKDEEPTMHGGQLMGLD